MARRVPSDETLSALARIDNPSQEQLTTWVTKDTALVMKASPNSGESPFSSLTAPVTNTPLRCQIQSNLRLIDDTSKQLNLGLPLLRFIDDTSGLIDDTSE
jgi:hypothetical protein